MAKKIRTESDRCAPKPIAPTGVCFTTGKGQRRSLERGPATRSKKNPGKWCAMSIASAPAGPPKQQHCG